MTKNLDYARLNDLLPGDIARRIAMGDTQGALRLIDARLEGGLQPELAPRLRVEKLRLSRLGADYSLNREEALAALRAEWPDVTEAQFDALVDGGRIDWRCVDGQVKYHNRFVSSVRLYPKLTPGMNRPPESSTAERDAMLARMREKGSVTARITIKASIRPADGVEGSRFQAWLPIPAVCPQQSEIEILDATPGGVCAPEDAPQRTIWWPESGQREFSVTYRYLHRAVYHDPDSLEADPVQPDFDLGEEQPHLVFTPQLRNLTARVTAGCAGPVEKARAIYDYVTEYVDYRYQPAYLQLDCIADRCAAELRGDCGVMALLFITLCRIAGIPAKWQSGLAVEPWSGPGCHDWTMFYVAPYGWMFADPSFGSAARRQGEPWRQKFYFGNLDPWRMVANSAFQAPLTPPDPCWRHDPYDNQLGEMTVDGVGLTSREMERDLELVEFKYL